MALPRRCWESAETSEFPGMRVTFLSFSFLFFFFEKRGHAWLGSGENVEPELPWRG